MDYFQTRLSTLNPRLKNTELFTEINSRLLEIRSIAGEAPSRIPSLSEVERLRDLAIEINQAISARVDRQGRIIEKD